MFALAERVAKLSNNRHAGFRLNAYKCAECGSFHVGSKVGIVRNRKRGYFYALDEELA